MNTLSVIKSTFTREGNIAIFINNGQIAYFSPDLSEHLSSDDNHWWEGEEIGIKNIPKSYNPNLLSEQEEETRKQEEEVEMIWYQEKRKALEERAYFPENWRNDILQRGGEIKWVHAQAMYGPSMCNLSVYKGEWYYGNVEESRFEIHVCSPDATGEGDKYLSSLNVGVWGNVFYILFPKDKIEDIYQELKALWNITG